MNLRFVVNSERLLSGMLARLAEPIELALQQKGLSREQKNIALQQILRDVGGRIGHGGLPVADTSQRP